MLPLELQRLLDDIASSERRAEALVADLSDRSVNWSPLSGSWSVAQCLNHLAVTNVFHVRGLLARVQAARASGVQPFTGLRPSAFGKWFIGTLEPPPKFKARAPTAVVPGAEFRRDDLVPAFKASHEDYRALVHASADVDTNRIIINNPFFNRVRMRLSTALLVIPTHERRHLWQAENVKRALVGQAV